MAKTQRNFVLGKMNKSLDERLVPNGEYIDALNIRLGSTEESDVGSVENAKGNLSLTTLQYLGTPLSDDAKCIGALADGANETIYWFVHDPSFPLGATGKLDMIVSFNTQLQSLTYHVITLDDGTGVNTTLDFNPQYLITGVNIIDEDEEGLLFFTDDYNPPRFINVTRAYPLPSALIDQVSAESLLVIKKPPFATVGIAPSQTSSETNFLEDRFVCFGYRYRYDDGEYSATSQFSAPSFIPKPFQYDFATGLNSGMLNSTNTCLITYNSGGPLVKSIDLLWKDMQTGNIRVIEKLDKAQEGLIDNTNYTFSFTNSKIFTVLPDSEILRLYDNVPRLAKAQTLMGNRLVYGNYVEQYDLVSLGGLPTRLDYTTELISEEIGFNSLDTSTEDGDYSINGVQTINDSIIVIEDVGSQNLKAGAAIDFEFSFEHDNFSGDLPFPTATTPNTRISFTYILPQDFATAYDLATSADFVDKIGTLLTIQPMANSCLGSTLTDLFNCAITNSLGGLVKYQSGINALPEPIQIIATPSSNDIRLQLPAVEFVDDPTGVAITQRVYEYYKIVFTNASFQEISNPKSLHSNRSYEIGIVYMDEFSRATTALVSRQNTIHVPCSASDTANKIRVNIPISQLAPEWATRYKFVIKPDKENYFTIYSPLYFRDPVTGADYFLLEGENARKVEEGDILIVKADSNGPLNRCAYATVLEKSAKQQNFLDPPPKDSNDNDIALPAGVYMKIRANDFSTTSEYTPSIAFGLYGSFSESTCPVVGYPVSIEDPANAGTYIDYAIPAGSQIKIFIKCEREGKSCTTSSVEGRSYLLDITLTSSSNYSSFKEWWDGDNVDAILNSAALREADCGQPEPVAIYNDVLLNSGDIGGAVYPDKSQAYFVSQCNSAPRDIKFQFFENTSGAGDIDAKYLVVQGFKGFSGKKRRVTLEVDIQVLRTESVIVFETQAQEALPDVWYESSESYAIDPTTGFHSGNVQDQTAILPAIIDTAFFNCFAFGNGVESYRIRDSIVGRELLLGNRVTTTSAQDYREIRRFADLTYSGVYNDETNVNKLNEFNLGLLNFKPLEDSYGPIYILDGRETDILVLQEDKISFVLTGKNLLTDSTGGSAVSSVPEVLGTQVARTEEYGISFHPESFAKWGYDKYFTDAKRGAVLRLRGTSGQSEQLTVVSELGMRSWFRDLFIESFDTQKLGAYDPYMDEYVLSSNNIKLPVLEECIDCGIAKSFLFQGGVGEEIRFCVNVGSLVGDLNIEYSVTSIEATMQIDAIYNGTTYSTGTIGAVGVGVLSVNKNSVSEDTMEVVITATGTVIFDITVGCPVAQEITIIQVCVSNNADAGLKIHNEYRWTDGGYFSPTQSAPVTLVSGTGNPLISQYDSVTGFQGGGFIPADGATVSIISNRILPDDDFVFQTSHDELRWLRTTTLYPNTPAGIQALLAASNLATPVTQPSFGLYKADFPMPLTNDQYLYLIYDYRNSTEIELCLDTEDVFNACCLCAIGNLNLIVQECRIDGVINTGIVSNTLGVSVGDFVEVSLGGCVWEVIGTTEDPATGTLTGIRPSITDCSEVCDTYEITNIAVTETQIQYIDCFGINKTQSILPSETLYICARSIVTNESLTISRYVCNCQPDINSLELRHCITQAIIYASNVGGYSVGQFVVVDGQPDCRYEIISLSNELPTEVIASLAEVQSCVGVCTTYQLENTTASPITVSYTDCEGGGQTVEVPANNFAYICAQEYQEIAGIVGTFYTCGCNPPQNLFLAQRCGDETQIIVDEGGLVVNVGDFVQLSIEPECVYEIISITAGTPVAFVQTILGVQSCDEVCKTYEVENATVSTQTLSYVDCDGVAQTADIFAGQTYYICARSVTSNPELIITFFSCGCNPQNFSAVVQRCGDGQILTVYNGVGAVIGDFVTLQSSRVCIYQVISLASTIPTDTISAIQPITNCTEVCSTWRIDNGQQASVLASYVDCNGVNQTISIIAGGIAYVCARTVAEDPNYTVTWFDCGCNPPSENLLVQRCGDSLQKVVTDGNGTGAVIGDFVVLVNEPDCIYQVISNSPNVAVDNIASIAAIQSCNDVCSTYAIQNPDVTTQNITYIDCNDAPQVTPIPAGQTWYICAKSVDNSGTTLSVSWYDCGCNLPEFSTQVTRCGDGQVLTAYNGVGANIGDIVTLQGIVDCRYQVTALSTAFPTETIDTITQLQSCADVCSTWKIDAGAQASVLVDYIDCNGVNQTISVIAGGTEYVCAQSVTEDPNYTVTWVDCGCDLPQNNFIIERCGDGQQLVVADGNFTGAVIGDFVDIASQPDCIYEVIAVTSDAAVENINSISLVQDCSEVCSTWSIQNPARASQTLSYVDCNGVAQTVDILKEQTWQICARSVDVSGTTLIATWLACGCNVTEFTFEVERCGDGQTEIIYNDGVLTIGDFVGLDDCVYQIIAASNLLPTIETNTQVLINDCDEVCSTWLIENNTAIDTAVNYVDCDGNPQAVEIPAGIGVRIYLCARIILEAAGGEYTASWYACGCNIPNYTYELLLCTAFDFGPPIIAYDNTGTVQLGDLVIIDGQPNCRFLVNAPSNQLPTDVIVAIAPEESCDSVCNTYNVEYLSGTGTFTYVDCNGAQQTINIPDSGIPVEVCLYSVVNSTEVTVTFVECGCNQIGG